MIFLIVIITIIAILIVLFLGWFVATRVSGNCPMCAISKFTRPTKATIDYSGEPTYAGAAATPIMGWSSWNTFRQNINEDLILDVSKAMVDSGLREVGYEYINIDDCWHSSFRDDMGRLQGDLQTFSRGIGPLVKDINAMGLKVGLYSSNGTMTCEDLPASLGNERIDAKTIASWGCEFFKYDFCHHKIIHGDTPMIENMIFTKPGSRDGIKIEPEDCEFTGRAKVENCKELPSGKAIALIGYGAGTASFNVNVAQEGEYVMTINYNKSMCRHERYMQITVDHGSMYEAFFPVSWGMTPTARTQLMIKLTPGTNRITIQNPVVTRADSSYIQYKRMGRELREATKEWSQLTGTEEKPITYSICEWGLASPHQWGARAGNMWRTTMDIKAHWSSIKRIYNHNVKLYEYACPGAWNDPDMLEVGNGRLTDNENKSHFTLWCMMAAPLVLGNDIRQFVDDNGMPASDSTILKIVTNKSLIAIDQDILGRQCKRIKKSMTYDILARPLQNGDVALCLFNKSQSKLTISFNIDKLSEDEYLTFARTPGNYNVHELWSDERFNDSIIKAVVPRHGVKVYRIHNS